MGVVGIRHRSFWLSIPVVAALCLPFGALWFDWIRVVQHSPGDLLYSARSYVFVVGIPVLAWAARQTPGKVSALVQMRM